MHNSCLVSFQVGAFDNDFYSGEKSKFEGYHTSLALHDDEADDDETPLIGKEITQLKSNQLLIQFMAISSLI